MEGKVRLKGGRLKQKEKAKCEGQMADDGTNEGRDGGIKT